MRIELDIGSKMIKTTEDIIYNNLKTNVGFHRSTEFKEYGFFIMHHVFGSYTGIKTSDYCSIPLNEKDHTKAERDKSRVAIEQLAQMINVMQSYIIHLEQKC